MCNAKATCSIAELRETKTKHKNVVISAKEVVKFMQYKISYRKREIS